MTKNNDFITLLTCNDHNAVATKTFTKKSDGNFIKKGYDAGVFFTHIEKPITSLEDLYSLLKELETDPTTFAIRGKIKPNAQDIVYRRIHGEFAAFEAASHTWVVLDYDKIMCPDFINSVEDKIEWVLRMLPEHFFDVKCVCKLSSSYGMNTKENNFSGHILFMLDRAYSDKELKAYFKEYNCPVDLALFSPVQPHYTAKPIFIGDSDPISKRLYYIINKDKLDSPLTDYINKMYSKDDTKYAALNGFFEGYCTYHNLPVALDNEWKESIVEHLYRMGFEIKNHSNTRVIKGLSIKMLA